MVLRSSIFNIKTKKWEDGRNKKLLEKNKEFIFNYKFRKSFDDISFKAKHLLKELGEEKINNF